MIERLSGRDYLFTYAESRKTALAVDQNANDKNKQVGHVSYTEVWNYVGREVDPSYADVYISESKKVELTPDTYQMTRKTFSNSGDETENIDFQESGQHLTVHHERTLKEPGKAKAEYLLADVTIDRKTGSILSHSYKTKAKRAK